MIDSNHLIRYVIDDADSDRVEINAMDSDTIIGTIVLEIAYDAHTEFEDAISNNEITEDKVNQLFPNDIVPSIKHLKVIDGYRRLGIGDGLMNQALDYFELNGPTTIYLNACPMGNDISLDNLIGFYESYDFKPIIYGNYLSEEVNVEMVRAS